MKYDPKQIKKEFKEALNKKDIKDFDNIMFYFIAEKVFKEINFENYNKKVDDLVWRVFIDTAKFLLHYGIIFREVLSEFRTTPEFKKKLIKDLEKEYKLNEDYKNLTKEYFKLKGYILERIDFDDEPDA